MANEYFTAEYEDYYSNLSSDTASNVSKAQKLYVKVEDSFSKFENIISGSLEWEGQMASLFQKEYFSYVSDCYKKISDNIINSLVPGYEKLDELVELLKLLKETNEKYMNLLVEYSVEKSKNVQPLIRRRNSEGVITNDFVDNPEYVSWINRINELALEIEKCKELLEEQKQIIFEVFSELGIYDQNVVELLSFVDCINISLEYEVDYYNVSLNEKSLVYDNLYNYNYGGSSYSVICESYFLSAYEKYLQDKGFYQKRGGWFAERCNDAATVYAWQLNNRTITRKMVESSKNLNGYGLSSKYLNTIYDANEANALLNIKEDVYKEIVNGRACALQVSRENPNLRHWVTVIGFNNSVTCPSDLAPENILVIDNWDGRIQTLSEYDRDFYAWESSKGKNYQIIKASSEEAASILVKNEMKYIANNDD